MRFLATRGLTAAMTACGAGLLVNGWMVAAVRKWLHHDIDRIPASHTAIVPGARVYPDGAPSPVLEDRLATALHLYRTGKVEFIMASGDGRAPEYDETEGMRRWLLENGLPERVLVLDPEGRRTQATMRRAHDVFKIRRAIVCTQAFHLGRSVFLARRAGIQALGLAADRRVYRKAGRDRLREFFARQVAFLESYLFT